MDEYQKKDKEEKKKIESEEEREGIECPNCHSINDIDIKFCAECGYDFKGGKKCPKCGAKISSPDADICEVCGEWILEGKCKFCYADLEEGANYCAECGNPVAGIICPQCGKLSYFDFCKFCDTPLTSFAYKMIEKVKSNPDEQVEKFATNQEARAYFMAQKFVDLVADVEKSKEDETNELLKMKEYIERVEKKEKQKKCQPLFTEKQKQSILSTGKDAEKEIQKHEEEKRRQEEHRRRQEEKKRRINPKGWLCNAFGVLHPGGPCECAKPYKGGHWVY